MNQYSLREQEHIENCAKNESALETAGATAGAVYEIWGNDTLPPDLVELLQARPTLPIETQAAILAIVRGDRPKPQA